MREMKDSGIEWIGEIPKEWKIIKCKYTTNLYTGNSIKDEEKSNYEDSTNAIPYIATKDIDVTFSTVDYENGLYINNDDLSFSRANAGDTLMCIEGGSAGRKKALLDRKVCFVNKLCCFHPVSIIPTFLYYLLNSPHYEEEFKFNISGLIGGVSKNKLLNFSFPFPTSEEQHRISAYLDTKCTKIDSIIEKQEKIIEKLKEYKRSVITEAVTKGLNPDVKMKDSGVEWIGDIPEHWSIAKIKNICQFNPTNKKEYDENTVVSYAPMECIRNGSLLHKEICVRNISSGLTYFEENDIVMAKVTPCFENGNIVIATGLKNGIAFGSSELFVVRANENIRRFLYYFLQNDIFKKYAVSTMTGTGGLKRVSPTFVNNYSLAIPPTNEQQQIADFLDKKCSAIDTSIEKKQAIIEKLKEYKKSLIYEVVTGKRDV